jgi:hypothetical protein
MHFTHVLLEHFNAQAALHAIACTTICLLFGLHMINSLFHQLYLYLDVIFVTSISVLVVPFYHCLKQNQKGLRSTARFWTLVEAKSSFSLQ